MGLTYVHLSEIQDSCSESDWTERSLSRYQFTSGDQTRGKKGGLSVMLVIKVHYIKQMHLLGFFVSFRGCSFMYLVVTNHHRTRNEC